MTWILTIRGSAEWRFTSSANRLDVTESSTGTVRAFWPGLGDPQLTESADSTLGAEYPVSVLLSPEAWTALSGTDPAGWTAEIAQIVEGADWRSRKVWADGRMDKPIYETVGDATSFSIIENPWEDRSLFPPSNQKASAATWGSDAVLSLPDNTDAIWYPWVFGCPGFVYPSDTFTDMLGWPVILVGIDTTTRNNFDAAAVSAVVVVAGHRCGFSSVKVYNRTTGLSYTSAVTTTTDLLQTTVTIATIAGADLNISEGDELWASCADASLSGVTANSGRPLRGIGEISRWLLERSTIRFDQSRVSQLSRLDRFKADFYVNEPTSAWQIIQDMVSAPIDTIGLAFPLAFWRRSNWGYFLGVQPWDNTTPILQITAEEGWVRDGGLTCSSGQQIITDPSLTYASDEAQGTTLRRLTYAPAATPGATVNAYCASAYAAIKFRKSQEWTAETIQDPTTATLILDLIVRNLSTVTRSGAFIRQKSAGIEAVGTVVSVTMPAQNLSNRLCWITSVQRSQSETRIEVATLPDLLRTGPK